jgi:hypothetical protein
MRCASEVDPLYCDVIVERFEKFTGKKAEQTVSWRREFAMWRRSSK